LMKNYVTTKMEPSRSNNLWNLNMPPGVSDCSQSLSFVSSHHLKVHDGESSMQSRARTCSFRSIHGMLH
jgi:hypothetical protein